MSRRLSNILFNLARLQADIEREQLRPRPNWMALLRMKLLRLRLRERMRAALVGTSRQRGACGTVTT